MGLLRQGGIACAVALVVLRCIAPQGARAEQVDEYQVKAAFLLNFAKFVAWPDPGAGRPVVIGIAGDDPFGDRIDQIVKGKAVNGRSIVLHRLRIGDDLRRCDIVFIGASEARRTADVLAALRDEPVLTVGETPHFIREGGLVRLFTDGSRVRFQIDRAGAEHAGLRISAQLLSLAKP